jgi:hypothetical protein
VFCQTFDLTQQIQVTHFDQRNRIPAMIANFMAHKVNEKGKNEFQAKKKNSALNCFWVEIVFTVFVMLKSVTL